MKYAQHVPRSGDCLAEFMVGGYVRGGGVGPLGEFTLKVVDVAGPHVVRLGLRPSIVKIEAYDDGFRALAEFITCGAHDLLSKLPHPDARSVALALREAGLADLSDYEIEVTNKDAEVCVESTP